MGKRKTDIITKAFANEYVANGFNATQAYKAINPTVTDGSAATLGHNLLKRVETVGAIDPLLTDTLGQWKQATTQAIALAQQWLSGDLQSQMRAMDYLVKFGQVLAQAGPKTPTTAKQTNHYHLPK
jgi:O-succinylbenzoate synthase